MASSDDKVRVNMTSSGPTQAAVRTVLEQLLAGTLPEPNRRQLLAALGHSANCVAPDHYRKVWQEERDRAERAEARLRADELAPLRADNDRLRNAIDAVLVRCREGSLRCNWLPIIDSILSEALAGGPDGPSRSWHEQPPPRADADADAEIPASSTCVCGHHWAQHDAMGGGCRFPNGCSCTAFHDRAWASEPQQCPRCRAQIHQNRRWGMRGEVCEDCEEPEPDRAEDCGYALGCPYDPPCQRHGDPDRQEMVRQLDVALHGNTWARPTSPSQVWRDLLGEVLSLTRRRAEGGEGAR